MRWLEIGAGFLLAGLGTFGFFSSVSVGITILLIGIALIIHGIYEELYRPWYSLEARVTKWLLERYWSVRTSQLAKVRFGFYFRLDATDESSRIVTITRTPDAKKIIAFTGKIMLDAKWLPYLDQLTIPERKKLVEDLRIFVAVKGIAFENLEWPLLHFVVQDAQPIDQVLSVHKVDMTAKNVLHTMIGARSIIRRSIAHLGDEGPAGDQAQAPPPVDPQP